METDRGWEEVLRLCTRQARAVLGASAPAADDAAQEAALRAWRHRGACHDPADPWPWVARIARREALRTVRADGPAELPELPDPVDPAAAAEERVALGQALEELPALERALLLERYVLDRTSEELGNRHDLTPGAVRVRLHRSTARLRHLLAEA